MKNDAKNAKAGTGFKALMEMSSKRLSAPGSASLVQTSPIDDCSSCPAPTNLFKKLPLDTLVQAVLDQTCPGGEDQRLISQHCQLFAYPQGDIALQQQRLAWLSDQGVHSIYSYGPKPIAGFDVLGLGYGGLVMLVQQRERLLALKLRRTDAPQVSLGQEAEAIAQANQLQIGLQIAPQLVSYNDDCLLMEYLAGPRLIDWLQSPVATFESTKDIIHQLLHQAFHLDQAGLDHGDLRCVTEHVHIQPRGEDWVSGFASGVVPGAVAKGFSGYCPLLIDFGKVSRDRRPANVTTLAQGLFLSTVIARTVSERFPETVLDCQKEPRRSQLIHHLRDYKLNPCKKTHKALLNFLES